MITENKLTIAFAPPSATRPKSYVIGKRKIAARFGVNPKTVQRMSRPFPEGGAPSIRSEHAAA
jgi:hypothetical protein